MARKSQRRCGGKASVAALAGLLILIVATLLAAGYAWMTGTQPAARTGPLEQVTIAANTAYAGSCPIIVAREQGYFSSEGIQAVVQPHSSGKAALEAVLQGQANLGTVADIPVMFAAMNDMPVSVIATIFKAEKDHGIVGRRDRGISAPEKLKGKRIGVTLGTSGHFTLDAFLNRHRLSPGDVTTRNYKPEELSSALAKGEVDAIASWEPFLDASMTALGGNGVAFYGENVYESVFNVAGTRDYIASHPEAIKRVLRALAQGAHFCSGKPDQARELVAAVLKTETTKLKASWPSYRFSLALDQSLILALEDEARWAIKNKLTSRAEVPNYLKHMYLDGLKAVTPSAVTVIH